MMLAEKLEIAASDYALPEGMLPDLLPTFNECAAEKWSRRKILRDFFTNQGPRFRPFYMRPLRHARSGAGRSCYPAFKSDK